MGVKYAESLDWDFGVSSVSRLVEHGDSEVKTASESLSFACDAPKRPNSTVVVVIAMGSTESYGPNRNADGFGRGMLQKYHNTFSEFGHVFSHHKNKDPKGAIGEILKSFYNPDMDRVELVISLDNNKASKFVRRINDGQSFPVSMGIKIPYDICNICYHRAPTTKHWCRHMQRGGDFGPNNMYYVDIDPRSEFPSRDGARCFVHNPRGRFFDISGVTKPADMTAYMIYGPRALENHKVAEWIDYMRSSGYSDEYIDFQIKQGTVGRECEGSDEKSHKQKLADMIKRIDGLVVGLDAFKQDPKFSDEQKQAMLAGVGIHSLSDALQRSGDVFTYPEVFKMAHMAINGVAPSDEHLKLAGTYQNDIVGAMEASPAVSAFVNTSFGLSEPVDDRKIASIRRVKTHTVSKLNGADKQKISAEKTAACALVAAHIFLKQDVQAETLLRGRAFGFDNKEKVANLANSAVALEDNVGQIFVDTTKQLSRIIF